MKRKNALDRKRQKTFEIGMFFSPVLTPFSIRFYQDLCSKPDLYFYMQNIMT